MNLNDLATLYQAQGKDRDAESFYRRSIEIKERTLGSDHADVATSLNNLAVFLASQERYTEAATLYRRALGILKSAFSSDHPKVIGLLENYRSLPEEVVRKQ